MRIIEPLHINELPIENVIAASTELNELFQHKIIILADYPKPFEYTLINETIDIHSSQINRDAFVYTENEIQKIVKLWNTTKDASYVEKEIAQKILDYTLP